MDIAYALGEIDGVKHTRAELLDRVLKRSNDRNNVALVKKSEEDINKEMYAHVNRIYRGSLGDKHVGIFTKDIAYFEGFMKVGDFVQHQLEDGKSIESIMEYLLQAKFDITDPSHRQYVLEHGGIQL